MRKFPGSLVALVLLGGLIVPLWVETKSYFVDYRKNPSAIMDNLGPSTALGRALRNIALAKGPLSMSPSYIYPLLHMIPEGSRPEALRGAPDFARLMSSSSEGVLGYEGVYGDWGPWLTSQGFGTDIKLLPNPWPGLDYQGERSRFEDPRFLGVAISWDRGFSKAGFTKIPNEATWQGTLWVPAPGPHKIRAKDFAIHFAVQFSSPRKDGPRRGRRVPGSRDSPNAPAG